MRRRIQKKLTLSRETLRDLSRAELSLAGGGIRSDGPGGGPSNCTDGCQFPSDGCTNESNCC